MFFNKKSKDDLPIIGSVTHVDFIEQNILSVPAKVDTGAFISSVWASQIEVVNKRLKFVLFKPGAPWYTGKVLSTKNYKVVRIKNSFGESEVRYQVNLSIAIESKRIKASVTLANRENNRYPILIGKKTLKNKFLVDVRHNPAKAANKTQRMAILIGSGGKEITAGLNKVQKIVGNKFEIDVVKYKDVRIDIQKNNVNIELNKRKLSDYQQIYFFTRIKNEQIAAIIAAQARKLGILYLDQAAARLYPNGKMHQYVSLAEAGVKIPDTVLVDKEYWPKMFTDIKKKFGLPFIFKDNAGRKGDYNYLINSKTEFIKLAEETIRDNRLMLAQQFIPNVGSYRVIVLSGKVEFVIYRPINLKKSHVFKKEYGIKAKKVPMNKLPQKVHKLAINAAKILEIDVAGVDLLQDEKDKKWYCLEVNSSPQLVSGSFVDEKLDTLAKFFSSKMDRL